MSETLWQKAYDEYVHDNSYQGKLKKENNKLKAKLEKIDQIIEDYGLSEKDITSEDLSDFEKDIIREILEKE